MKATSKELLKEIAENLTPYLMLGNKINLNSITKKIEPNLNINNIKKLLKIHFVLTKGNSHGKMGVISFMQELTKRIRRIKTSTLKESERVRGRVSGKINWKETITKNLRYGEEELNELMCVKTRKYYDISENLVLKKLLKIIYNIIKKDLQKAFNSEYNWLKEWISEENLKSILTKVYLKNIYLSRINLAKIKLTKRMINKAIKSRNRLYREAGLLLLKYQKLMNYELNEEEAKDLLRNTFIKPGKTDVLFELYWILKIIKQFKVQNFQFELIEPGNNLIATWTSNKWRFKIYHDSTGSLRFYESIDKLWEENKDKKGYLRRQLIVLKKLKEMTQKNLKNSLWGGRPDIILEKYKLKEGGKVEEHPTSIFIGEVKYTNNESYAIKGLKELLEYIALIRENDMSYFEKDALKLFNKMENLKGGLFIDQIENFKLKTEKKIKIYEFGQDSLDLEI